MKKIPEPDLSGAKILSPAELNRIHFGGNHTPLPPEQTKSLGAEASAPAAGAGNKKRDK